MEADRLWTGYGDILRQLYIADNMTLAQVKGYMESNHGFPQMRLCDYEIALREQLKLKKNLKREDWYCIGLQIAARKKQGKETEVVWNNRPMKPTKVRKEVLRNRRYVSNLTHSLHLNSRLPGGLVLRSPARSLMQDIAIVPPLQSGSATYGAEKQPTYDSGMSGQLSASRLMAFRGQAFFNQFLPDLIELARDRLFPGNKFRDYIAAPSPRLFGNNPSCEAIARSTFMLSNRIHGCDYWKTQDARWFLSWCGTSADPRLLRAFFSMKTPTVRAVYENLLTASEELKDVCLFTSLYNLRHAVDNDLTTLCYYFFRVAVRIGSAVSRSIFEIAQQTCPDPDYALDPTLTMPAELYASWIISKAAVQADIPMMQLCISIGARLDDRKDSLGPILRNIMNMQTREDQAIVEYLNLLVQGGFFVDQPWWPAGDTGLHLCLWEVQGLTIDRVIYESFPEGRKRLYSLFHSLTVVAKPSDRISLAGVLTFAQDGPDALKAYVRSHEHQGNDRDVDILERCLSEAAHLGEIRSVSGLLEAGVNPNVPSLSREEQHGHKALLWSPVARAAMAGNPEMLRLLLADSRLDIRPFVTSVTTDTSLRTPIRARRRQFTPEPLHLDQHDHDTQSSGQHRKEDAERLEAIEIIRAVAQSLAIDVDANILNATFAHRGQGYDTGNLRLSPSCFWEGLCYFRLDGCHALLIPGLVESNMKFQIHGLDLLHLSIRNGCSLQTTKHLLQRGFKIESQPCGRHGKTMLHSALLSQSMDRSDIVDLLLQAAADFGADGGGITILEASLADDAGRLLRPQEYLEVFKRLFKLGAPVGFSQGHRSSPKRRSLINLLLDVNAEDDLILEVVDAGVDVNDRGGGIKKNTTPLQHSIESGRLTLAAELIRRGADVSAQPGEDRHGYNYTALQKACATNAPLPFIRLLVQAGANVNEPPPVCGFGLTSLEYAAGSGLLNMAQYLLEQGARVNSLGSAMGCDPLTWNPAGIHRTRPLDWAACNGRLDMVSFLLQIGGRSGRPGRTGLDGAIDAASILSNHFAVAKVLRDWASEHRSRLLEDEAAWQHTNTELTGGLPEVLSEDDISEFRECVGSGTNVPRGSGSQDTSLWKLLA